MSHISQSKTFDINYKDESHQVKVFYYDDDTLCVPEIDYDTPDGMSDDMSAAIYDYFITSSSFFDNRDGALIDLGDTP